MQNWRHLSLKNTWDSFIVNVLFFDKVRYLDVKPLNYEKLVNKTLLSEKVSRLVIDFYRG